MSDEFDPHSPDDKDVQDVLLMAAQRPTGIIVILREIYSRGEVAGARAVRDAINEAMDKKI